MPESNSARKRNRQQSRYRPRDVKDRHGKHIYSLRSFGLNADQMDETYAFYTSAFRIPEETAGIAASRQADSGNIGER